MALDRRGAGRRRPHKNYAWMRIGYKTPSGGGRAHKGAPVYAWVLVGSDKYNMLQSKGGTVYAVRRRRALPDGARVFGDPSYKGGTTQKHHPSLNGVRVGGDGPKIGTKAGNRAMDRLSGGNGGGVRGGGGKSGGGKRRKRGGSSAQTTQAVAQMLGSTKAGKRLGGGYADKLAGVQFDAPIHDIKALIDRLGPQNQQAISDLSHWFGNVSQLNAQAGARSGQIANEVAGNQDAAVQGLMAALGGGANQGNQNIAALQASDSGYQRVLGGIQQQYHANMDPILAGAEAAAKEREQRLNMTQMQDYQLQLADLLGQRGQAKATNQMEVDKYNNELAQQWFQNKLAKLNANLGAQAAGVDMQAKLQGMRQNQRTSRAQGNTSQNVWRRMNPAQRDELLQRATGAHLRADGTMTTQRSMKEAQAWLSGVLKNPVGSGKNAGLLTMLYQYYH